jgi:Ca2+-binding EF-hand superfamily protein
MTVTETAWQGHRGHGDHRGACDDGRHDGDDRRPLFDRLDRNDDGVISRSEWPRSQDEFDRLDRNDDGRITRREFASR